MSEEEWVKEAMTDAMLVAKVLLSLLQGESPPPLLEQSANKKSASSKALQLEWSVRQRRSKQALRKRGEPARASPTTPLSWSGGVSVSGGGSADGAEESSPLPSKPVDNARSKVAARSEATPPNRSRRKKLDYQSHPETAMAFVEPKNAISDPSQQREVTCHTSIASDENDPCMPNGSCGVQDISSCETSFMLPDLNLPFDDDSGL